MRRIDAIAIVFGVFLVGGALYGVFKAIGFDETNAGIWSQVVFLLGLLGWVGTYLYRAATQKMSYVQQRKDYEDAVMQKRLDEMTPEALAQFQSEVEAERQKDA
jgi:Protein of unknown function (DUF3007)